KEEAAKFNSFSKSAHYQSGSYHCKHPLKRNEQQFRNGVPFKQVIDTNSLKEYFIKTTDKSIQSFGRRSKRKTIADYHPFNNNYRGQYQTLHQHTQYIFPTYKTSIKEGQSRYSHHHYQDCRYHNPCSITTAQGRLRPLLCKCHSR